MKKILSGLLVGSILLGGTASVYGAETNVDGEESASITVNGTLGQDNTDPEGPNIEEGSKDWINVTLDTANIFYTTKDSAHKDITSPEYKITNNSGRGVKISTSDFSLNSGSLENVKSLSISGQDAFDEAKSVELHKDGEEAEKSIAGDFLTLANKDGKLNVDADGFQSHKNETTYKYAGETKTDYYTKKAEKTSHTLTLAFEALGKDGNPVVAP